MKPFEFLRVILPTEGHYAVVGIKNKKVKQKLINSLSEMAPLVRGALANDEDIYFGCSSYATPDGRTKANVLHVQSFWLDLDCNWIDPITKNVIYPTQQDGFTALRALCKSKGLPKPFVVNSGRGLHVYWPLTAPLLVDVWLLYSKRLVELCAAAGLKIKDPGCSTDPARILRIPGTLNFKNPEEPLEVGIICEGTPTDWPVLKDIIETACGEHGINGFHPHPEVPQKKYAPRQLDPLTAALAGNIVAKFRTIARLSLAGAGCNQIRYALEHPADVSEPLWRCVLSVAQVCEDRDMAIHKVSEGHPEYSHEATERKANETHGPCRCETFEKAGPELCEGCPLKGKMAGPIALGRELAKPKTPPAPAPVEPSPVLTIRNINIPDLPFPYSRGEHGGIYLPAPPRLEGQPPEGPQLVYEHELDVVRRIKDPEKGEVIIVQHKRPKDGIEEIVIPLADAQSIERMKDKLGFHGVAAGKEQMNKIANYMVRAVKNMQQQTSAEPAHCQMGWTADRKGIVWGRTMFTKEGRVYCPPAGKSTTVANMMTNSGSFEVWESIASRYAEPGFELYACCVLMAFGSMLNHYTYEDPVWVHMVSSESGTGKTTLTNVINSIWGDPFAMKLTVMDTVNALEKRRVIFNSMAICQDEITNLAPEKLSQLAYAQSQGREKLRLTSGAQEINNTERRNNTFFTNGNRHISDVLGAFKTNAAGEYARLVEIPFAPLKNVVSGDDHFGKILKNYGHAGPIFAKWLVEHETELEGRVAAERRKFEREFNSVSSERNWVGLTATGFAAGRILQNELGLLKAYNLDRLYKVWLKHMLRIRSVTQESIVSHEHVLGDFINENYSNILIPDAHPVTEDATTANLFGRKTERESRNKLVIRWEKDTRMLFIAQSELKAYCIKRSHSFVDMLAYYNGNQQFAGMTTKRLGAGTSVMTSPVKCLAFHVTDELGTMLEEGGSDASDPASVD